MSLKHPVNFTVAVCILYPFLSIVDHFIVLNQPSASAHSAGGGLRVNKKVQTIKSSLTSCNESAWRGRRNSKVLWGVRLLRNRRAIEIVYRISDLQISRQDLMPRLPSWRGFLTLFSRFWNGKSK